MPTLNEVKEQMTVVRSVGEFTNALQQIATIRMVKLRESVLRSRPFVEAANEILAELTALRNALDIDTQIKLEKKHKKDVLPPPTDKNAVIVITSNQGLTGRYNIEIYQKIEKILEEHKGDDFYIIGKKGQEYFGHFKVNDYPYEVGDDFEIEDLQRLIALFDYYAQLTLVYSHYVNSATRDVVVLSVVKPTSETEELGEKDKKEEKKDVPEGKKEVDKKKKTPTKTKYIYEPDIIELIDGVSRKLRAALFQQQIYDARLSQFSAQMIGMKTASDNATGLLGELQVDYNKQRRKMIDKKISEVFAGSALW